MAPLIRFNPTGELNNPWEDKSGQSLSRGRRKNRDCPRRAFTRAYAVNVNCKILDTERRREWGFDVLLPVVLLSPHLLPPDYSYLAGTHQPPLSVCLSVCASSSAFSLSHSIRCGARGDKILLHSLLLHLFPRYRKDDKAVQIAAFDPSTALPIALNCVGDWGTLSQVLTTFVFVHMMIILGALFWHSSLGEPTRRRKHRFVHTHTTSSMGQQQCGAGKEITESQQLNV